MPLEESASLNAVGLVFTIAMAVMLFVLPRRLAILPFALTACYITVGQQVIISGLNFTILRILALAAAARIVVRAEYRPYRWLRIDTFTVLWVLSSAIVYTLLWQTSQAFINRLGHAYTVIGLYFIFRIFVRDLDDIKQVGRIFGFLLVPLALLMCVEKMTGRNPFFMFGGVPEFSVVRGEVVRCQGPFRHSILAGTFAAVWVPLFVGLWWQGKANRLPAALGMCSATAIMVLAGSSGPVATYLAGIVGLTAWSMRRYMRQVLLGLVVALAGLHIVMQAPVWFIVGRVSAFSGSTGWHRANLIDKTIANFSEWWLLGVKDTARWGVWGGDITNQYVAQGVTGGLITLVLFVSIIVLAFSNVAQALRAAHRGPRQTQLLLWTLGSVLFAHVITFIGVTYFDQNQLNWYLIIAMIAAASIAAHKSAQPGTYRNRGAWEEWCLRLREGAVPNLRVELGRDVARGN